MKRRKRPDDPTVSLFPFLTVLICTIGMLIVLLVISVRAVGSKSQQIAEQNSETQRTELAQLQADLDLQQIRAEGWTEIRENRIEQLRSAREERSYLEQTLNELGNEARQIATQLQELDKQAAPSESLHDAERKIEALRQQLDEEERKKPDEAAPLADAPVMYNLVPYSGTGGTSRRPIYVECVNQKLILQPSGIELKTDDFVVPGEPGNPLDAALSTIKEYWQRYDLAGSEGTPYPLLVVRPSGAQAYAVARRAMTSWVDEFGYELIPENKPIRFGPDDPQLAAEIRKAVELARKNQALLAEQIQYRERVLQQRAIARQMATGGGGGSGLRADRARGGFTSDSRYASTHNQDGSGAAAVKKLLGSEGAASEKSNESSMSPAADSSTSAASPGETSTTESTQFQLASRGGGKSGEDTRNQFQPTASKASDTAFQPSNLAKAPTSGESAASAGAKSAANSQASNTKGEGGPSAFSSGIAPPPLADSRGADWALPGKNSPRATAYLRPIRVICSADELVIVTGPNSPLAQNLISFGNSTGSAVEPLVASLWRLIDSWGPTPDNGYWKPVLKVETLPGGEARTRDLQALMQNSGIDLAEEKQ